MVSVNEGESRLSVCETRLQSAFQSCCHPSSHTVSYEFHIALLLFPTLFVCLFQSHSVAALSSASLLFRLPLCMGNTVLLCYCRRIHPPPANRARVREHREHCRLEATVIHLPPLSSGLLSSLSHIVMSVSSISSGDSDHYPIGRHECITQRGKRRSRAAFCCEARCVAACSGTMRPNM